MARPSSRKKSGIPARRRRKWLLAFPAYLIRNTDVDGRYRIEKEVLTDPWRDVVLQRVRFVPLQGTLADFRLYVLLAPHLANRASGNTAWVGEYKGTPMLFAERENSAWRWPPRRRGLPDRPGSSGSRMAGRNCAPTGGCSGPTSAPRTATSPSLARWISARRTARSCSPSASVPRRWRPASTRSSVSWRTSTRRRRSTSEPGRPGTRRSSPARRGTRRAARCIDLSAAVLRTHESKRLEGGVIASLSIPWGFSKGDDDLGGYHLIWPRDLVETAAGFLAVGARHEARRVLRYLQVTQEADGHWTQNMWLDGTPYWHGIQMDETALPILLVDLAAREGVLDARERDACWPMVRKSRRVSRLQWSGESSGSLGGRPRLFAVHYRRRNRRTAGRRRSGRRGRGDDGRRISAGNGRRVEREHRAMAVCDGHRTGTAARRRGLLRARRGAGPGGRRVAVRRLRPHQEPTSGSVNRARRLDGQPRRARLRALRTARGRRSADGDHREGHRCDAQGRHAARSGVASLSG